MEKALVYTGLCFSPSTLFTPASTSTATHGPTATTPVVSRNRQARGHSFFPPRHLSHFRFLSPPPALYTIYTLMPHSQHPLPGRRVRAGPPFPLTGYGGSGARIITTATSAARTNRTRPPPLTTRGCSTVHPTLNVISARDETFGAASTLQLHALFILILS